MARPGTGWAPAARLRSPTPPVPALGACSRHHRLSALCRRRLLDVDGTVGLRCQVAFQRQRLRARVLLPQRPEAGLGMG